MGGTNTNGEKSLNVTQEEEEEEEITSKNKRWDININEAGRKETKEVGFKISKLHPFFSPVFPNGRAQEICKSMVL